MDRDSETGASQLLWERPIPSFLACAYMSQGQACMPFHSSPAQSQTTQSPLEKLKFNANIWKLRQNKKFKNEFGLWESHINWNQQMLQCPTFSS